MYDTTTRERPATVPAPAAPDPLHIVAERRILAFLRRLFRRAPRALCGELMWGDPDRPGPPPYPQSPLCPTCIAIDGGDPATLEYVPRYWI